MSALFQALCLILLTMLVQNPPPCSEAHVYITLLFRVQRANRHTPQLISISGRIRAYEQRKHQDLH